MAVRFERLSQVMTPGVAGDTLQSSVTTEQSFASTCIVRGGVLKAGDGLIFRAKGVVNTLLLSVNTLTLRAYFGSVVIGSNGSLSISTAITNGYWSVDEYIDIVSGTTSPVIEAQGQGLMGTTIAVPTFAMVNTTTLTGPSLMADQVVKVTAQYNAINVSPNTIQLRQMSLTAVRY